VKVLHEIQYLIESEPEVSMDEILTEIVTPISEFKKTRTSLSKRQRASPLLF
jgi:hypothetical protein